MIKVIICKKKTELLISTTKKALHAKNMQINSKYKKY